MPFLKKILRILYPARYALFFAALISPFCFGSDFYCDQRGYRNTFTLQVGNWVKFHADASGLDNGKNTVPLGNKEVKITSLEGQIITFELSLNDKDPPQTFTIPVSCVNCVESDGKQFFTNDDLCIVPI